MELAFRIKLRDFSNRLYRCCSRIWLDSLSVEDKTPRIMLYSLSFEDRVTRILLYGFSVEG